MEATIVRPKLPPMIRRFWSSGPFLLAVATLFWAGNFVLGRAIRDEITPFALAFWRWAVAFLVVLGFAWPHLRRDLPVLLRRWPIVVTLAVLGVAVFNTLVYLGLHTTTVINGVLLQSTMPLIILAASFLLFGERVSLLQVFAILLSLLGVAVIVTEASLDAMRGLSIAPGDAWIFLAVCCYALYSVLLRKRPAVHPLSLLTVTFAIGALILLPFFLYEELATDATFRPTRVVLAAIVYVAVFPSLVSYLSFNRAVELIGANRAGQFLHLMPVFGSILAAVFLAERLQLHHLFGAALIAGGIILAHRRRRPVTANDAPS